MIGGDQRALSLEKLLLEDEYEVSTLGLHPGDEEKAEVSQAEALLFPYPFAVRRDCVPAISGLTIHPEDVLALARPGVPVLAGRGMEAYIQRDHPLQKYEQSEKLLEQNAAISAEAALWESMRYTEKALMDMQVLITGYGLFGRALALRFLLMGAAVCVAARRQEVRRLAAEDGMQPLAFEEMDDALRNVDLVLNTVPARVLEERHLRMLRPGVPLLELASAPYGFDRDVAAALGHPCEVLTALPARYAPLSAAMALRNAVNQLLQEGHS